MQCIVIKMLSRIAVVLIVVVYFVGINVHGAGLNGHCEADDHCGTVDSYCNNGTCVCTHGFVYHDGACIQVADPRYDCRANSDCKPTLGTRSICKDASCACLPYHHLHNDNCIKNRGLHERCDEDYQCYWGKDMEDKMGCINGECYCKSGYRPHQHRKCEGSSASTLSTSAATLSVFVLLNKLL